MGYGKRHARQNRGHIDTIIVAESGADIPQDVVRRHRLHILPMHVSFDRTTLLDGSFPIQRIYEFHDRTGKVPSTSAVNPEEYRALFETLHAQHPDTHIMHLSYSAVTTSTYENALVASEGMPYVTHVDTKSVSGGQAAIVIRCAEYIEQNPAAPVEVLKEQIDIWIRQIRMGFIPGDLAYLKAGGRVSNATYLGASILSIKPLIEIRDGSLVSTRRYRGSMTSVARRFLKEYIVQYEPDRSRIYILFSEGIDPVLLRHLEMDARELGAKSIQPIKAGGVITSHGGPGALGIAGFATN